MKRFKQLFTALLVIACVFSIIPVYTAKAAERSIPKTVRSVTGLQQSFTFDIKGKKTVKSVSTSNKAMIAKVTDTSYSKEDGEVKTNSCTITTYCEKDGKYTVTVKYSDKSKSTVTVYNYPAPKFTVKINGKNTTLKNTTEKECKVEVSGEKDYPIKKLEYVNLKKEKTDNGHTTKEVTKEFKSGGKIVINKTPSAYKSEYKYSSQYYSSESEYESESLFATTYVRITYKDKYTKENASVDYYVASVIVP